MVESPLEVSEQQKQPGVVILLLLGHVAALALLSFGLRMVDLGPVPANLLLLSWIGLLCGQMSLAAVFGALAPLPLLTRLPLGLIAATSGWLLILTQIPGVLYEATSAGGWASMAAWQFAWVALGSFLLRIRVRYGQRGLLQTIIGQYNISTLLAWTTLVAVALGVLRLAFAHFGWNQSVLEWDWFRHLIAIGTFNAAFAIVGVASVLGSPWSRQRRFVAIAVAALLVWLEPFVIQSLFGSVGVENSELWFLSSMQVASLFLTLFIVRSAGGLAEQRAPQFQG